MNKKNIIFLIKVTIIFILLNFLLTTFVRFGIGLNFGLDFLNTKIINILKDFFLLLLIGLIFVYKLKNKSLINTIKEKKVLFILLVLIIFFAIVSNYINGKGINFFIIGFKYDIWPFIVIFFISLVDFSKQDIQEIYYFFLKVLKYVFVFSIILAFIRFIYPNLLYHLGFGPLGDWQVGNKPPVFYKTGVDGIQRLQGIFSGPNNFSFFLIAFGPLVLLSIFKKKLHFIWGIIYLILLFGTLSRSAFLAFGVQFLLMLGILFRYYPNFRKYIYGLVCGGIIILLSAGIYLYQSKLYEKILLKQSSTTAHIERFSKGLKSISQKPIIGYGIGTAGPSAHYTNTNIIPESWILQIFYELGILGGSIRFFLIFYILTKLKKDIKYNNLNEIDILKLSLFIGLIGLIFQGIVLHSFEDSMTVLVLAILIGISLGYKKIQI